MFPGYPEVSPPLTDWSTPGSSLVPTPDSACYTGPLYIDSECNYQSPNSFRQDLPLFEGPSNTLQQTPSLYGFKSSSPFLSNNSYTDPRFRHHDARDFRAMPAQQQGICLAPSLLHSASTCDAPRATPGLTNAQVSPSFAFPQDLYAPEAAPLLQRTLSAALSEQCGRTISSGSTPALPRSNSLDSSRSSEVHFEGEELQKRGRKRKADQGDGVGVKLTPEERKAEDRKRNAASAQRLRARRKQDLDAARARIAEIEPDLKAAVCRIANLEKENTALRRQLASVEKRESHL